MSFNIITATDSYKMTHWAMMPDNTEGEFAYFESRAGATYPYTVFFGLQYILKKYLEGTVVTQEMIDEAADMCSEHFGRDDIFNRDAWEYILNEHDGRLPVRIRAVNEGTVVPVGNVLMTVESTDPECSWITKHVETMLTQIWYPSTVATAGYHAKGVIADYMRKTSDAPVDAVDYMLHDFGYRGVSSQESALVGGMAHLVNFKGTDTLAAIHGVRSHYNTDMMPAFSVPATEHSVMTSLGEDGESEIVGKLLDLYPTGILSVVADSFDIFNFVENIVGETYRDRILERDGVFVVRPDSGDPVEVTLKVLDILSDKFGTATNRKGYEVLNPKVRVLWGDGIDIDDIDRILGAMEERGYSSENIVFGMGGGLLQKINRDTQRFAFKSSAQKRDGIWEDVYKSPIHGGKSSKRGRLTLTFDSLGEYKTVRESTIEHGGTDLLNLVFEDGEILHEYDFTEVRNNVLVSSI